MSVNAIQLKVVDNEETSLTSKPEPSPTSQNNQDALLLNRTIGSEDYILHDNRIYVFKGLEGEHDSTEAQNLILNLLTTPKFRAMNLMYSFFRMFDNISLLIIIVLTIMNGKLVHPKPSDFTLFALFGADVFHKLMDMTHKYWILQRLSIYIGLSFFVAYALVIGLKSQAGDYQDISQFHLLLAVVSLRFIFFVLEEFVDVAIDGELHRDLKLLYDQKKFEPEENYGTIRDKIILVFVILGSTIQVAQTYASLYYIIYFIQNTDTTTNNTLNATTTITDHSNFPIAITIWSTMIISFLILLVAFEKLEPFKNFFQHKALWPKNFEYVGSFLAWSPKLIHKPNNKYDSKYSKKITLLLCAVPALLSGLIVIPFALACGIVALIVYGIFGTNLTNCWKEVTI